MADWAFFFKWVKQNLKIKTFLGTFANAVMTQVWGALCLYLILAFIRFISKTVHSMREILNWICINLFSNEILNDYLVPKMTEPIVNPQLALFWKVAGQQWVDSYNSPWRLNNKLSVKLIASSLWKLGVCVSIAELRVAYREAIATAHYNSTIPRLFKYS